MSRVREVNAKGFYLLFYTTVLKTISLSQLDVAFFWTEITQWNKRHKKYVLLFSGQGSLNGTKGIRSINVCRREKIKMEEYSTI